MSNHPGKTIDTQQPKLAEKTEVRKPYIKPLLVDLGDLRSLTLGSSPTGYQDSGGALYSSTFPTP